MRGWPGPPAGVGPRTPGANVGWRCGPIAPNTPPLASVGSTSTSARSARPSRQPPRRGRRRRRSTTGRRSSDTRRRREPPPRHRPALGAGLGHAPHAEADPGRRKRRRGAIGEDRRPLRVEWARHGDHRGIGRGQRRRLRPERAGRTIPTSSTTGTATPTRRSVRRAGDRGLVGAGSTIIRCQWYVPGRRPDDRRAPLLCTDGADRGARGRHRAELLAGDDAGAAGPTRRDPPATRRMSWSSAAGSPASRRRAGPRSSARASCSSRPSAWAGAPRRATAA